MAPDDSCFALNNCDYSRQQFGGNFGNICNSWASAFVLFDLSFSARRAQKKCNFIFFQHEYYTWGLKWNPHAEWKSYFVIAERYLCCSTCAATHTHTHSQRARAGFFFLWVILATDSGPVIVSGAAGSEASLSYWPASISHWAKTQGWWHCRWEHVNFAL